MTTLLDREPSWDLDGYPPRLVEPAHVWVPRRSGSYADEVVEFSAAIGHPVDAEQACDLDVHCSYGTDGTLVAGEAWEIEGRQNGKTDRVILPWTLFDWFLGRAALVDWTSHLMDTTLKTKRIVDQLVEANPLLSCRVKSITDARGSEGMTLMNGREWRWASRSEGAGRGGPADVWVADEGLYLTQGMVGARRPTLRSRHGSQLRGASSAGKPRSGYLAAVVKRGRGGGDPGLSYVERCAPGGFDGSACEDGADCSHVYGSARGCAMDREELWHLANHGLARGRIMYAKLREERRSLSPEEWGREGMGWHEVVDGDEETIDVELWDTLADRSSAVADGQRPDVFVVGVRPDRTGAVVAVAGRRADKLLHVGLIRRTSDAGAGLVAEVLDLRRKHRPRRLVVIGGPGSRTVAELLRARVPKLHVAQSGEQAAAAADLLAGIKARDFRHLGDRIVRASLEGAPPRRTSDGGWSFDTRIGGDVLPILAVTVARAVAAGLKAYDPLRSFG